MGKGGGSGENAGMKAQSLAANSLLVAVLGAAPLLSSCSADPEAESSATRVDIGYPLERDDPRAILDVDANDYPEVVVKAKPTKRLRPRRPFTGMTHYDLESGRVTHRRFVDGRIIEEELPEGRQQPPADPEREAPGASGEEPTEEVEFVRSTLGLMEAVDRERERAAAAHASATGEVGKSADAILVPRIDSTTPAARTAVRMFTVFDLAGTSGCSGSLIGRRTVLTAGHCLRLRKEGKGRVISGRVVPGLDGTYMPFGDARIVSMDIDDNWEIEEDNDDDWGLVYLDRDIGSVTGTLGVTALPDSSLVNAVTSIYGYPGSDGMVTLHATSGQITCVDEWSLFHNATVVSGMSGSAVTKINQFDAIGVVRGEDYNAFCSVGERLPAATRITGPRATYIRANLDESTPRVGSMERWSSLGGAANTQVTGASWGTGRLDYFMRGTDNAVWHKWQTTGGFAPAGLGWEAQGGQIIGKVGAVSRGANLLDLVVRSYGNPAQICTRWFNGTAWGPSNGWQCFSDFVMTGSPTVISSYTANLHVFARNSRGRVFVKNWSGSGGWAAPIDLGGNTNEDVAAVSRGYKLWDIFIRDAGTGRLCTKSYNNGVYWPSQTTWSCFSGTALQSAPVAVALSRDAMDVFYTTYNGVFDQVVSQMSWRNDSTQWQGPFGLGGSASNSIAAVSRPGSNRSELYVVGSDGVVYTKSYMNGAWQPSQFAWTPLGGDMLDISAFSQGGGRIDLVARSRSLTVFHRFSTSFGTWN
jgi:V8-like Glu-specific endopeptidase